MTTPGGVLTLGETMASLRCAGPFRLDAALRLSIAGAESNVAIGLARLGHRARWVGVVGDDPFGRIVLRALRAEGVEISARVDPDAPTGMILFEQRVADVTNVVYRRAGSAGSSLAPSDVEAAFAAATPEIVHLTGITPALGAGPRQATTHAAALASSAGAKVCFNVNYRASLWPDGDAAGTLATLASAADLVVAARSELAHAVPWGGADPPQDEQAMVDRLLDEGVTEVLVTAGAEGATLYRSDGMWHRPAARVRAVDSVGAGDAFVAGYLAALLEERAPTDRLDLAVTVAGFAVASEGDWDGLPTRRELPLLAFEAGATIR